MQQTVASHGMDTLDDRACPACLAQECVIIVYCAVKDKNKSGLVIVKCIVSAVSAGVSVFTNITGSVEVCCYI